MYFNTSIVQVDKQGRITLPTSLFKSGGIERGGELCVYPMEDYWVATDPDRLKQVLETEIPGKSMNPETRDNRRVFMMKIVSLYIDLQGRVQFQHLDKANKTDRYVVIGTGLDFEIWPLSVWQERFEKGEEDHEQNARSNPTKR
ncbi:MAG: hypothetical protein WBM02_05700 [bacterium]